MMHDFRTSDQCNMFCERLREHIRNVNALQYIFCERLREPTNVYANRLTLPHSSNILSHMGLFVNIFVLTLLLVPRLSFQLAVTTLGRKPTLPWPWRNHSRRRRSRDEVCYRTWNRWLPNEVPTSRRSAL